MCQRLFLNLSSFSASVFFLGPLLFPPVPHVVLNHLSSQSGIRISVLPISVSWFLSPCLLSACLLMMPMLFIYLFSALKWPRGRLHAAWFTLLLSCFKLLISPVGQIHLNMSWKQHSHSKSFVLFQHLGRFTAHEYWLRTGIPWMCEIIKDFLFLPQFWSMWRPAFLTYI